MVSAFKHSNIHILVTWTSLVDMPTPLQSLKSNVLWKSGHFHNAISPWVLREPQWSHAQFLCPNINIHSDQLKDRQHKHVVPFRSAFATRWVYIQLHKNKTFCFSDFLTEVKGLWIWNILLVVIVCENVGGPCSLYKRSRHVITQGSKVLGPQMLNFLTNLFSQEIKAFLFTVTLANANTTERNL
jgi:hypothetical protein